MTTPNADSDALVQRVARVLLDTADVHDLGWNNLRTTAEALLPLFADAWDEGYGYAGKYTSNPYRPRPTTPGQEPS